MKILRSVLNAIKASPVGSGRPEHGGALFSNDGGETISRFCYDANGSRSSGTYSPDTKTINELIKAYSDQGYYFVGLVHSHPQGYTGLSMGKRAVADDGYTASDEEAIHKLLKGMNGTKRLYFPVVQSAVYGKFSMRMFYGEKDCYGRITIYEDGCIQIVEDGYDDVMRRGLQDHLPMSQFSHSTAVLLGAGNAPDIAEGLTRQGINKFVLLDSTRFEFADIAGLATYDQIGGYKVDVVARRIRAINPMAQVKIIRQYIDQDIDLQKFGSWLANVNRQRSVVVYCENTLDDFACTQRLCAAYGIALIRAYTKWGHHPNFACTYAEFYDYWGNPHARGRYKLETARCYRGMPLPSNNILLSEVSRFFGSPIGKKERRALARSDKEQAAAPEKYEPLYTKEEIGRKKVAVIGCGGSRSYIENLARAGVKHFLLIDGDAYGHTNLQTQMAYADEMDRPKAAVIADQVHLINPEAEVEVVEAMLDEAVTDEQFAAYIGEEWLNRPSDVLIAACTDNVIAQERCSRLALKYGFPFLMAGIYQGGRVMEIVFFHPEVSTVCPRCIFNKRVEANLSLTDKPAPAQSNGTSVFITEQLNAHKGFISLSLLLYHSPTADKRYSEFLDDNKWKTPKRERRADRNFMFFTMDSRMEEHSGRKAYAKFDKWGQKLGSNFQLGVSFFRKQKPLKHCPDCGGKGHPLITVKGRMADTREGLYPKEEKHQ